jgi:general secretion pathway protein J
MTQRDAGFTLLEMLVALVVFGLVMAGLTQSFKFGLAAWSASSRYTTGPENLAAMDTAVADMIAQAAPDSMTGHRNGLSFTTRLPASAGQSGLADAAILLSPDGTLILRYQLHPPGIALGAAPAAKIEPLAQGVTKVTASYLVPQTSGPAVWSDNWSGSGLPLLVRIHLEFANGRNWPDLVSAPVSKES